MGKGIKARIFVEFGQIFDEDPKDLRYYLRGISKEKLLLAATFFLGFNYEGESEYDDYRILVKRFFRPSNKIVANHIYAKLGQIKVSEKASISIINPISSLQLFEFCYEFGQNINFQSEEETEINIFKACLLLNTQNALKDDNTIETTKHIPKELKMACSLLGMSFPHSDLVNYDINKVFIGQVIKACFLFEFAESDAATRPILNEFLFHFNCTTWKEYLRILFPLHFATLQSKNESHIDLTVDSNSLGESFKFIDKLSVSEAEIIDDLNFKTLRNYPLYKVSEGVYRIIFKLFLFEKIFKGLYFKFNELNEALPLTKKISDFRSHYCLEFSENYLVCELLNSIYKKRYVTFSGKTIRSSKDAQDGEPDYYVRNGKHLLLFESKDILINSKIKTSHDFGLLEAELKKKLYFEIITKKGKEKIKNSAVVQLASSIKATLQKKFDFDKNYKSKSLKIYPILILHDRQYDVSGLNTLLNSWFEIEIEKLKSEKLDISQVYPLVIIDIDTLIFYQDILRDRKIRLEDVINDYRKSLTFTDYKRTYRNEAHRMSIVEDTFMSFSTFLDNYVNDRSLRKSPKMLKEKAMALVQ